MYSKVENVSYSRDKAPLQSYLKYFEAPTEAKWMECHRSGFTIRIVAMSNEKGGKLFYATSFADDVVGGRARRDRLRTGNRERMPYSLVEVGLTMVRQFIAKALHRWYTIHS